MLTKIPDKLTLKLFLFLKGFPSTICWLSFCRAGTISCLFSVEKGCLLLELSLVDGFRRELTVDELEVLLASISILNCGNKLEHVEEGNY